MILLDTGPIVALFDPKDADHAWARSVLAGLHESLVTTLPVLTEAFHLLGPETRGASALREFLAANGARVQFLDEAGLQRALELMEKYADPPMDLADASLVVAAESLRERRIFTLDVDDFRTYRATLGRTRRSFELVGVSR